MKTRMSRDVSLLPNEWPCAVAIWALSALGFASVIIGCEHRSTSDALDEIGQEIRWTEARTSFDGSATRCIDRVAAKLPHFCTTVVSSLDVFPTLSAINQESTNFGDRQRVQMEILRGSTDSTIVSLLERELLSTKEVNSLVDLTATLLGSSGESADWSTMEATLKALEEARELSPGNARILFNHAIAMERLGLIGEARSGWKQFLDVEPNAQWRSEALARASVFSHTVAYLSPDRLIDAIGRTNPKEAQEIADSYKNLLARILTRDNQLLEELLANRSAICGEALGQWTLIGDYRVQEHADFLLEDLLTWGCSTNRTDVELSALDSVAKAIGYYKSLMDQDAERQSWGAMHRLAAQDGPLFQLARLYNAMALFGQAKYQNAERQFVSIVEDTRERYPTIAALSERYLGTINGRRRNSARAELHYLRGLRLIESGADQELRVRLTAERSENLANSGKYDEAFANGITALRSAYEYGLGIDSISTACDFLAIIAAELRAFRLQEAYANCAVDHIHHETNPAHSISALVLRAQARLHQGDTDDASADLRLARSVLERLPDSTSFDSLTRYIELFEGLTGESTVASESFRLADSALDYFSERGDVGLSLFAARFLSHFSSRFQDSNRTETLLERQAQLALVAIGQSRTPTDLLPIQHHYRYVLESQVGMALDANEYRAALATLLEFRLGATRNTINIDRWIADVSGSSPDKYTLVLASLGDSIGGWLIGRGQLIKTFRSEIRDPDSVLARAVGDKFAFLPGGRLTALGILHDAIIDPISEHVPTDSVIRIVPDGPLFGVPFSSLWDLDSQSFLIERYAVSIAPEPIVANLARKPISSNLSIGILDASQADRSRPLRQVYREIRTIKRHLEPVGRVIVHDAGGLDLEAAVLTLATHDVVHFIGHAYADPDSPLNSRLLLGDSAPTGLTAQYLYEQSVAHMPTLLVLAGCETSGFTPRLPHSASMVRPFLALGTSQVLGSLHPIHDKTYPKIMELFYSSYANTRDPVAALRLAQRQYATTANLDDPHAWSSLQIYSLL